MQKTKIIRFLLLLILIQALAMLYHSRQEIHAFIDAHFSKEIIKNGLKNFTFFKKDLPTIDTIEKMPLKEFRVDVPFANWRWVNATIAADTPRTKIPAKLHVDGKSLNCTIRVSFGAERHWIGERKSIRLRFPDVGLYKGIRELNLNIPETEMIIIDGVAWEFAKVLGLPTPEYDFVNLYINNHYEGVRLLYEDADGYFLERNGLMGYIFTEEKNHFPFHYESAEDSDYPTAKVINKKYGTLEELRHLCKVLSYPSDRQFQEQIVKLVDLPQIARWYAHALICGSGHQNVHNIKLFYNTALQKFQALPWDIAGFGHWGGWPGSVWQIWKMDLDWATNHLTYRLNMMPEFIEIRNHILWETLNGELSLENQLAIIDKYYKKIRYHVYTDNRRQASAHRFSIEDFENAIEYLKSWARKRHQFMIDELQKADLRVSYATLKNNTGSNSIKNATGHGEGIVLAIGTGLQSSVKLEKIIIPESGRPIEFKKIKIFFDKNANDKLDIEDYEISVLKRKTILDANGKALTFIVDQDLYPARKVYHDRFFDYFDKGYVLQPRPFHRYYNYLVVYEAASTNGSKKPVFANNIKIEASNAITGAIIQPEYFLNDPEKDFAFYYKESNETQPNGSSLITKGKSPALSTDNNAVSLTSFLEKRGSIKHKVVPAGNYELRENLRIEPGVTVVLSAGTRIALHPGVSILVRGELHAEGRANAQVVFENALPGQAWGCLAYYKTNKISTLCNTVIRYGSMAKIDSVSFTGSVSAYYATIVMDSCSFEEIQADDGINIKYSESRTLNSRFIAPKDDAIDYDFCEGEIRNCYFYKSGGDAIDCGTANPLVVGNVVEYAADKGVSVGEGSSPTIEHNILFGGNYGIAVKDDSNPIIRNNTITGNNIGLSFYIKKPDEFGCPSARVSKMIIWGNNREIENLCEAEFNIQESAVNGGYSGKNIYTQSPVLLPNDRGHKTILQEGSFYAQKEIGARR